MLSRANDPLLTPAQAANVGAGFAPAAGFADVLGGHVALSFPVLHLHIVGPVGVGLPNLAGAPRPAAYLSFDLVPFPERFFIVRRVPPLVALPLLAPLVITALVLAPRPPIILAARVQAPDLALLDST